MLARTPLALIALLLSMAAMGEGKHVHGEAELYFAIQGSQVLIELETPADNLLGFEHEPETKAQHQLLDTVLHELEDYRNLVTINDSSCKQLSDKIDSPFKSAHKEHGHHKEHDHHGHDHHKHDDHKGHKHDKHDHHKGHDHNAHHGDHKETHSDFRVAYTLQCDKPVSVISITAFEHFKGFERITVNWLNDKVQGSIKATQKNANNLALK